MKSTAFASLLALVPAAVLCAPVPIVLVQDLEAAPVRPGPPLSDVFLLDDGGADVQIVIDNRPVTPPSGVDPAVALAAPQPVATTYLLSLAKHRPKQAQAGRASAQDQNRAKFATTAVAGETGLPRKPGMPCYMHHRRRDSTDVMAIGLVATFLLVIVLVETWEGVCERYVNLRTRSAAWRGAWADGMAFRARSFACAQGPIHLDFDEEPFDEKVPLSVQADEGFVEGEQEQQQQQQQQLAERL